MPDPSRHASNAFGTTVTPIDFTHPHAPHVQTYHGLSIVVDNAVVGKITQWTPQAFGRTVTAVREINHRTFGRIIDSVPGVIEEQSLSFAAAEVWADEFEKRVGYPVVWADLADQTRPFTIHEYLFKGVELYRVWVYLGCWFRSKNNEGFEAEGTAIITVSGDLSYVRRYRAV